MKLAMHHPSGPVFTLSSELIAEGLRESRLSPRRRMLLPIHRGPDDLVQRMINFLQPGTYIRAHLHPRTSASETIYVISGQLGFITFDDEGTVESAHSLSAGELIDIESAVWHSVLALVEDTVILEIKRGPYDQEDKLFADWAPREFTPEAELHLHWLRERVAQSARESE